jgi:hypothetical protein
MNPELINYFTENTEYEFKLAIDNRTKTSIEELSDLESRTFPVKDCWEFIGFIDGVYLAASQKNHIPELDNMGSEYNQLVNEMLDDQVLRRMNLLLGKNNTKVHYIYSELRKISRQITNLENDFKILIKPGSEDIEQYRTESGDLVFTQGAAEWTLISIDNSEVDLINSEDYTTSSLFVRKYKDGFSLGANVDIPFDSQDIDQFYHTNNFDLPFSVEYVILASEENH